MIEETLRKLEERIQSSKRTGDGTRTELLALVKELRTEFASVAETHGEEAAAIAQRAQEATRDGTVRVDGSGSGEPTADGRAADVEDALLEFESAHPRMVGIFRSLMRTLADAGI